MEINKQLKGLSTEHKTFHVWTWMEPTLSSDTGQCPVTDWGPRPPVAEYSLVYVCGFWHRRNYGNNCNPRPDPIRRLHSPPTQSSVR